MPTLNSGALTTLANTKTYLGISGSNEDSLLISLINSSSAFIEKMTGRTFKKTAYTEYLRGTDSPHLFLKNYPIIGLVDLSENRSSDTTDSFSSVNTDLYWTFNDEGYLEANGWTFIPRPRAYRAVYEAGYIVQGGTVTGENIALPNDLELACWRLVAGIYNQRKAEGTQSQSLGDYSVQFTSLIESDSVLKQVLSLYQRPAL